MKTKPDIILSPRAIYIQVHFLLMYFFFSFTQMHTFCNLLFFGLNLICVSMSLNLPGLTHLLLLPNSGSLLSALGSKAGHSDFHSFAHAIYWPEAATLHSLLVL